MLPAEVVSIRHSALAVAIPRIHKTTLTWFGRLKTHSSTEENVPLTTNELVAVNFEITAKDLLSDSLSLLVTELLHCII